MKKKTTGKSAAGVLVASALTAAMLAGCSGNNNNNAGASSSAAASPSASASASGSASASASPSAALPEPAKISIFTEYSTAWPPQADWGVWKWVKEETNITVEQKTSTTTVPSEALALAVSSGDMADVMSVFPGDVQKFGSQGAFLDLSKHMDKMPNVKAYLDSHPVIKMRVTQPDGKILNIINDGAGAGNQLVWFYREDIFDKNGLTPPKTWDELYETSKKLKQLYPDSYPLVFRHGLGTLSIFAPSFGILPELQKDKTTGKMTYGPLSPNYKTMIEYLNKFYKEGLFPPDWLSMDYKAWTQFMATNKSFISVQYIGQIETMNNQLTEGRLKFMAPPLGAGDKAYLPQGGYEDYGFSVASNTKNLDAALRYLDYIYSEKGRDIQSWGKEGETYTIVDGKRKLNDVYKESNDLRRVSGILSAGTYGWFDFEAPLSLIKESEREAYVESPKYQFPVTSTLPILSKEETDSISTQIDAIYKYYSTSISKFIMGETPLTEWDNFIKELDKYGLQKVLQTYQVALDRQTAAQ
ncbi:extracellular solute-binding protein [Cohnella sp. JJ-181]|uniref:extracellular solute-binding protein n=1 Tax=Cohnella rhizoplanae TaxID=2974897 RepID=UPI0022FFBBDB|nr:extracellular solute-binding protein [Cohnella sp. JJ-181]CAI6082054.1 hypothetical protein COHCIP112018_03513 [Cohnella sp. JJ-181]